MPNDFKKIAAIINKMAQSGKLSTESSLGLRKEAAATAHALSVKRYQDVRRHLIAMIKIIAKEIED